MQLSLPRRTFEFLRRLSRETRLKRQIPDADWRRACESAGIEPSRVQVQPDHSLKLNLVGQQLVLPKTSNGLAIFSAFSILDRLASSTDSRFQWDRTSDSLIVTHGDAVYRTNCFEEIYIIGELYLSGDYDFLSSRRCVIIDIGANVGYSSIFLAHSDQDAIVEAFEPLPLNYHKALRNIEANPSLRGRVTLHNFGLYSEDCARQIISETTQRGMSSIVIDRRLSAKNEVDATLVSLKRASIVIDNIQRTHPDRSIAIKMDCEGSEYAIVKELAAAGALTLIDFMVLEWHRLSTTGTEIAELRGVLHNHGYNVYFRGRLNRAEGAGILVCWRTQRTAR